MTPSPTPSTAHTLPGWQRIRTQGIDMAASVVPPRDAAKPTVVLLHGFPELAFSWRHQIRALADAGYGVLAPDLRGYDFGGALAWTRRTEADLVHTMRQARGPTHYMVTFQQPGVGEALLGANVTATFRGLMRRPAVTLDHIGVPALMISAADDFFLPPTTTRGMERIVPDLERHTLSDCGHWTQQEQPEAVNALLLDWLARRMPPALSAQSTPAGASR